LKANLLKANKGHKYTSTHKQHQSVLSWMLGQKLFSCTVPMVLYHAKFYIMIFMIKLYTI